VNLVILAVLCVVSMVLAPAFAYWVFMERRWSGLKTLLLYTWYLGVTNALFWALGRMLGVGGAFENNMLIYVLFVVFFMLVGVLMLPRVRARVVGNLEWWRDTRG
jgi:hypothetical protein